MAVYQPDPDAARPAPANTDRGPAQPRPLTEFLPPDMAASAHRADASVYVTPGVEPLVGRSGDGIAELQGSASTLLGVPYAVEVARSAFNVPTPVSPEAIANASSPDAAH